MNFVTSIATCFSKYIDFNGRASRSEYWWFCAFVWVVGIVMLPIDCDEWFKRCDNLSHVVSVLWWQATVLPCLAASVRRLHDIGRSGHYLWIAYGPLAIFTFLTIPDQHYSLVGGLMRTMFFLCLATFLLGAGFLIFLLARKGSDTTNKYGKPVGNKS